MATKNAKNSSKNKKQPETKMILVVKFTSLCKEKEQKYLGQTPLMKWNPLKPKSIILVIGNIVKDKFLSLHWNLASFFLSLSSYKKKD
jgi:hypothetical protein